MDKAPDALRTIGEVAEGLDVPHHVLRFWETRFPAIKPLKRSGGRRYYRPEDVALVTGVRRLLYDQGYTIKGVQRILRERGQRHVQAIGRGEADAPPPAPEEAEAQAPLPAEPETTGAEAMREVRVPDAARIDAIRRLGAVLQDLASCRALLRASDAAPPPAPAPSDGDAELVALD